MKFKRVHLLAVPLIAVLLCSFPARLLAVDTPGPMNFIYNYYSFAYTDTTTYVELHYQFSQNGLRYNSFDDKDMGKLMLRLRVRGILGVDVISTEWVTTNHRSPGTSEDRTLMGMKALALPPGSYRAQILYRDLAEGGATDSAEFTMNVRSFAGTNLQVSDIQLVSEAEPSEDRTDLFYKNGYRVMPNVTDIVAAPILVVNAYLELYYIDKITAPEYNVAFAIVDTTGRVLQQKEVTRARPSDDVVTEFFSTTVEELSSGNYFLVVTAYNGYIGTATDSVKVLKFFAVRNPDKDFAVARQQGPLLLQADVIDPIYAGLKEEELDLEFSKVKPIVHDDEKRVWKELKGPQAKGRFLTSFWLKRDPTLETVENEYHDSYNKLVEKAHALYYSPMNPNGWDTDRGRVMLQYGEPDYIDRHQNEFNKRPYQVWSYTNQGYQFVFVDRTQTGSFMLVHSNAPGERRFENWDAEFATIHNSEQSQGTGNYAK